MLNKTKKTAILILTCLVLASDLSHSQENQSTIRPEQALTQFERDYVLLGQWEFEFEENFSYTYYSANQIFLESFAILDPVFLTLGRFGIESAKRHIFVNTFFLRAGLLDNLQFEVTVPFVYRYDMVAVAAGTGQTQRNRSMDRAGIGDIAFSFSLQPIKETSTRPALVLNLGYKTRTGTGPFEIDTQTQVPTGSGYDSLRFGLNLIKSVDPAVIYGGVGYIFNIPVEVNKVISSPQQGQSTPQSIYLKGLDPGDSFSFNIGMAYALSYTVSVNFQYLQTYTLLTRIYMKDRPAFVPNSILNSALFKVGAGITAGKNIPINFGVYVGLTDDAPDYMIDVRIPVKF